MRIDLYTKPALTVIAGARLYLRVAVTPIGTPVSAQVAASHVHIAAWVDNRGGVHSLSTDEGLPMRLGAIASPSLAQSLAPHPSGNPYGPFLESDLSGSRRWARK